MIIGELDEGAFRFKLGDGGDGRTSLEVVRLGCTLETPEWFWRTVVVFLLSF